MADQQRRTTHSRGREPARTREEAFDVPPVEIYETEDGVVVLAEMPGVGEAGVDVQVDNDQLTLTGRSSCSPPKDAAVLSEEFASRSYRRVFTLSRDVAREGIKGRMQNGLLRIELPKAEAAKARRIPIQTE